MPLYSRDDLEGAESLSTTPGPWIVASIETTLPWPLKKQLIRFNEIDFLLIPAIRDILPAIGIAPDRAELSFEDARIAIMRFCSALTWQENGKLQIVAWTEGNVPRPIAQASGRVNIEYLEGNHLPIPSNSDGWAAIALYREALSIANPFYSFLSFFKVITISFKKKKIREKWLSEKLLNLSPGQAANRIAELHEQGIDDFVAYLNEDDRHAIAHAERPEFANPDSPEDHIRILKDIPVIRDLAAAAIEDSFHIQSVRNLFRDHPYQLAGFKRITDEKILGMMNDQEVELSVLVESWPDTYALVARRGNTKFVLENVTVYGGRLDKALLILLFNDSSTRFQIKVQLDFTSNSLILNPMTDINLIQDRHTHAGVDLEILFLRFRDCIFGNGHLEIWDQESEILLGETEPYIPNNFMTNKEALEKSIADLEKIKTGISF